MSEEMKNNEVCPKCGKVHEKIEHLGIKVSKEDSNKLKTILSKAQTAKNAMSPNSIPENTNQEKLKQYLSALNEVIVEYMEEESQWWNDAIQTYSLPTGKDISLDNKFEEFVIRVH